MVGSILCCHWLGQVTGEIFFVEQFFQIFGSPITTLLFFCICFARNRCDPNLDKNYLFVGFAFSIDKFCIETKTARLKTKCSGPGNVNAVNRSVQQFPSRSARKHAVAFRLFDRSVKTILHRNMKMHPYKIVLVEELRGRYFKVC